ncbi:LexA repressor [Acetobacter nitrogenifigens DSM 23921 = NBRC 105050]|uniref:LexA repressor n=1 Tax=Acetobacter nitrogenifigens DSM 23921 = NBRC 105050 TaxID=1120919 RepID=A0A511X9X7_9PROT|nr:transcriptional repressor LexA [Acetobacter nitrogenifigens]GBQ98025.1 LexA repressor [Acetobacter nitrogenifigens DSM 23921 = NBRC 105050]GEN59721.1 LexA repressor [Acetobacter nitrogenifigens DSM 23921 = NBRC 105050]
MLTRKQHELLLFIDSHLKHTGFSPSFDEMKEALGLKSKSGVHRLISALEERGFLQRRHNRARALEILRLPAVGESEQLGGAPSPHALNVIKGDFSHRLAGVVRTADEAGSLNLPLYGRIAAGLPIEALRDNGTHVAVPLALLGQGEHYALEVAGDSMIEAGILDGDTVIIRKADTAETGQIVVALIDEAEVTLKRLRKRGAAIALEAANPAYETRIVPAERLRIQGRLVGLLRNYN